MKELIPVSSNYTEKVLARLAVVFGAMSLPAPATDAGARLTVQPAGRA